MPGGEIRRNPNSQGIVPLIFAVFADQIAESVLIKTDFIEGEPRIPDCV